MKQLYLCLLLPIYCYLGGAEQKCAPGYYFVSANSDPAICAPCQDGSDMPDNDHNHRKCLACTELANRDLEILVAACNQTHDTVILCQTGYYRYKARIAKEVDRCVPCTGCEVPARKCQGYSDTVCCLAGELCDVNDHVVFDATRSLPHDTSNQAEVFQDLQIIDRHNGTSCGHGFYIDSNINNGTTTCAPCSEIPSSNMTSSLCKNCPKISQLPVECRAKEAHNIAPAEFRLVSFLLFSVAIVVDSMYVFLYARSFLRKYTGYLSRRSCLSVNESRSRMIGTAGIDVHCVFICIHLFGILCEVNVVNMDEEILWRFTVCSGALTVVLYFFNAILFLFVKRVFCAHVCISYRPQRTEENVGFHAEDAQVFLDNT